MKLSRNQSPLRAIPVSPQSPQMSMIMEMVQNILLALTWLSLVEQSITHPHHDPSVFCSRKSRYVPSCLCCPKWAQVNLSNHSSTYHTHNNGREDFAEAAVAWMHKSVCYLFIYSSIFCTFSDLLRHQESPVDADCIKSGYSYQVGEFGWNWFTLWCQNQWSAKGVHYFRLYSNKTLCKLYLNCVLYFFRLALQWIQTRLKARHPQRG